MVMCALFRWFHFFTQEVGKTLDAGVRIKKWFGGRLTPICLTFQKKTCSSGFRNPWQTYVNQASLMPKEQRLKEHLHELA